MSSNHKPDNLAIMMLAWFDDLKSLDDGMKNQLRNKVIKYQEQLLSMREVRFRSQYVLLNLFKLFWRIGMILPLAFLITHFQITASLWEWLGSYGIVFAAQYLFYRVTIQMTGLISTFITLPLDNQLTTYRKNIQSFLLVNITASFLYVYCLFLVSERINSGNFQLHLFIIASILITPLIIFGSQLLLSLFMVAVSLIIDKILNKNYPTAAITSFLIHALALVEIYPGMKAHESYKPFVVSLLESGAKLILTRTA